MKGKIMKIGNVSFGAIKEQFDARLTAKQRVIHSDIHSRFEQNSNNEQGYRLVDYIEDKMGADVFIKYKKNGNVEMSLQESQSWLNGEYPKSCFAQNREKWLNAQDKKPVTISANKSYDDIEGSINDYAENCDDKAADYESLNEKLALKLDNLAQENYPAWKKAHPNANKMDFIKYCADYGDNFVYNPETGEFDKV